MLVCGGVKHDLRTHALEGGAQTSAVPNVGDERLNGEPGKLFSETRLRFEDAVFTVAEQQQQRGVRQCDLPAQLATDRPTRSGHHHPLPRAGTSSSPGGW